MSINFITITMILLHITMIFLSSRMVQSKKRRPGQFPGAAWSHLAPTYHPQNHSQMCASWLHCHPSAKSRGLRDAVVGTHAPHYPFLVARAQSVHLELTWWKGGFQGDEGPRSASSISHSTFPFPKSVGPHCSPTMWQHCVIAALVYKQARLFKCHCKKDAA